MGSRAGHTRAIPLGGGGFTTMGLGQNDSLGAYCGPHTASSVFLIFTTQLY